MLSSRAAPHDRTRVFLMRRKKEENYANVNFYKYKRATCALSAASLRELPANW